MAIVEILTVTVGRSVVRAVVKQWVGDDTLLGDMTDDTSMLLGKAGLDFFERRRVARELEEVTERIAERLGGFFEAEEFGGLPSNEREAAAHALAGTIDLGFADPSVALAEDLDAGRLEKRLRRISPSTAQDALLSDLAIRLYDIALAETSAYLVAMVENLPRFAGTAFAELLARDRAIMEKLDTALEHLPRTSIEQALTFETRYMREVARQLDQLRLYGFTASEEVRRYQLSVAYISLSVSLEGEIVEDAEDVYEELALSSDGDEDSAWDPEEEDDGRAVQLIRVEEAVLRKTRLLIRGDAGSGKTTLLSWLAVNAARRSFQPSLDDLTGLVPFFVSLRRYADEVLPAPDAFVDSVASAFKGLMPADFVEQALDSGRALVLIDGVDELPPDRRDDAQAWLDNLTSAYPKSRYVVTSRPPAVDDDWLQGLEFEACRLEDMSLADVDSFIDHWHLAIKIRADEGTEKEIEHEARRLKQTIRRQAPLRRLATSPLLCAMLCALHHDGSAQLPRDRVELYDRALDALLERRDADRRVVIGEGLSLRNKRALLRSLAYWFLRNAYTSAPRQGVVDQIKRSLTNLRVTDYAASVFDGLLERTGLLREPIVGQIDFIHRTFLEYLAAQAIVENDDLGYLIAQAHVDTFGEVVVLAAGVANVSQRDRLITGLLSRAEDGDPAAKRLQLLAVACLETVTVLDPALTERVERVLEHLVPPSSLTAANELASAGELAVGLLAPRVWPRLLAVEARACVRTLGLIGTEAALDQLALYGADNRVTVVRELMRQWNNFDQIEYARRVLAESPLYYGALTVHDDEGLAVVPYLKRLRVLTVYGQGEILEVGMIAGARNLTRLKLSAVMGMQSLTELAPLPALRSLELVGLSDLTSIEGVQQLEQLEELTVSLCAGLDNIDGLSGHPNLRTLVVDGLKTLSLEPLRFGHLQSLRVEAEHLDALDVLSDLPHLMQVELSGVEGDLELFPLVDANELHQIVIDGCHGSISPAPVGRTSAPLDRLVVADSPSLDDRLDEFGSVTQLELHVDDLSRVAGVDALGCKAISLQANEGDVLPPLPAVEYLALRLSAATSLNGLPTSHLTELRIDCPMLQDLSMLAEARALRRLRLFRVAEDIDLRVLSELPDGCTVHVNRSLLAAARAAAGDRVSASHLAPLMRRQRWGFDSRPLPSSVL